jgi:hypothetical protein
MEQFQLAGEHLMKTLTGNNTTGVVNLIGVLGTMERRVRLSHWFSRGSADSALGLVFRATKYT